MWLPLHCLLIAVVLLNVAIMWGAKSTYGCAHTHTWKQLGNEVVAVDVNEADWIGNTCSINDRSERVSQHPLLLRAWKHVCVASFWLSLTCAPNTHSLNSLCLNLIIRVTDRARSERDGLYSERFIERRWKRERGRDVAVQRGKKRWF